jgi:hypothetical protein
MLDLRLPFRLHSIETTSIELLNLENMGVAVGISFLSHLKAEIQGGVVTTPSLVTYVAKKLSKARVNTHSELHSCRGQHLIQRFH